MPKKKNISLTAFLSTLSLVSCFGVNAAEKNESTPKPVVSGENKSEPPKKTNETDKNNNGGNSFTSTVKNHPIASTLVPVSVVSLAIVGGYFKFFRNGDQPGGEGHPKAKATIDAMNKLDVENINMKNFISGLGGLGDGTVRVVVDCHPEGQFQEWCDQANTSKDNFMDAVMIIKTIITDALNTPNTEQSSLPVFKYEDRNQNLKLPKFGNFAWLRLFRDCLFGNKKYSIWFGMDKNNEDLHIKIDLSMGWNS